MRNYLLLVLLVVSLTSCEKLLMPKSKATNAITVFDELWKTIDRGYSQFEDRKINWDSVYVKYKVQVSDTLSDDEFFMLCSKMLDTLHDEQIRLDAGFATYYFDTVYNTPGNFNRHLLEQNYWKGYRQTGPLIHTIIDSVGYIYYESFTQAPTDAELDAVITRFWNNNVKGTIIDVRDNSTGGFENIYPFFKRINVADSIPSKETFLFSTAYKNGTAHDDFTAFKDSWTSKVDNVFPGRQVVLTNRKIYGAATLFAAGASNFATLMVMGDTTRGGGSEVISYELPNGWIIRMPGSLTKAAATGENVNKGIYPDIRIDMKPEDEKDDHDTILDRAIAYILD